MKVGFRSGLMTAMLALGCAGLGPSGAAAAEQPGAWSSRVQVIYDAETRSVERRQLRVWDAAPEKNLDFVWEPASGSKGRIAADGTVNGEGRLVWRVRGSASYDPKTVFSSYRGQIQNGRFHGKGRLEIRSGEILEGEWRQGRLDGQGLHRFANGDTYTGAFRYGLPEGEGRLAFATGEIYSGSFHAGLRHGIGETRLAGGSTYRSAWNAGVEQPGARPDGAADALTGGLVRAQSKNGGDAGRVEIGVIVEPRMTQQSDMRYTHLVADGATAIYPEDQSMNDAWNGQGEIGFNGGFGSIDWESAPAFVEVDLDTTDKKRVKLDTLELEVETSEAYRKPMLSIEEHIGCVGFRPTFTLLNNGWGDPRDIKLTFHFEGEAQVTDESGSFDENADGEGTGDETLAEESSGEETDVASSREAEQGAEQTVKKSRDFSLPVADFGNGLDVAIDGVLRDAGVDTNKLRDKRFSCASMDGINVCRSKVFNDVGFGEIADFVYGDQKLSTTIVGVMDYTWQDDAGESHRSSEPFRAAIALATIEVPQELAECGDGFGGAPEAMRFQDVKLPINKKDYTIPMPVRGNRNISHYEARLKMSAEMSSYHEFRVAARFADGSVRQSNPVRLFYFRPKPSDFKSQAKPATCYLSAANDGC